VFSSRTSTSSVGEQQLSVLVFRRCAAWHTFAPRNNMHMESATAQIAQTHSVERLLDGTVIYSDRFGVRVADILSCHPRTSLARRQTADYRMGRVMRYLRACRCVYSCHPRLCSSQTISQARGLQGHRWRVTHGRFRRAGDWSADLGTWTALGVTPCIGAETPDLARGGTQAQWDTLGE
jgi:hypothetical protein